MTPLVDSSGNRIDVKAERAKDERNRVETQELTPLMERVLRHIVASDRPQTGNEIGSALGLIPGRRRRGPWTGPTGVAQRAIPAITALRNRGLIMMSARPDGLSGTADAATDDGYAWVRAHPVSS